MASVRAYRGNKYLAKVADKQMPCAFCQREVDEETLYGKLYKIGDIYCHYFCVLLSCCLIQKGRDEDGLFGFMYPDILAEIERSKKHKCSYCCREGATLGCSVPQCRKQFHLPCGRERQAVSLFFGNYKSFCKDHAPKQKIPDTIMSKAKQRMRLCRKIKKEKCDTLKTIKEEPCDEASQNELQSVCVICYEAVDGFPTNQTFWPPCCARDAWFHRSCLERMALSAGVHYLKCPLCNDKENFYRAVLNQGYYIPDRDAAWELERNAFSDIYERPISCTVDRCKCPKGRNYDADTGDWDIELCVLCGAGGAHAACASGLRVCTDCAPAAPAADSLARLAQVPLPTQSSSQRGAARPLMPSRMSLRRTKARQMSSTSSYVAVKIEKSEQTYFTASRSELNLKSPKKRLSEHATQRNAGNKLLSPLKLLERDLYEKILSDSFVLDQDVLAEVQNGFRRPKPLVEKKKTVNEILERFMNNISKENVKTKEPLKEWNSPKKTSGKENVFEVNDKEDANTMKTIKTEIKEEALINITNESSSVILLNKQDIKETHSSTDVDVSTITIHDTPNKLKTINIEHDSMEISKRDHITNIDLIKINEKSEKFALKFSNFDNEALESQNIDMDVESFKNHYLNEVDRHFKSDSKHNNSVDNRAKTKEPPKKRKMSDGDSVARKRRKTTKMVENKKSRKRVKRIRKIKKDKNKNKNKNKKRNELSISNKNINLKIKWRDEELKLKIKSKRKSKKNSPKVLKQYVLKYYNTKQDGVIGRPDCDVVPIKKQIVKTEKTSDHLKQTSIDSFFKTKPVMKLEK